MAYCVQVRVKTGADPILGNIVFNLDDISQSKTSVEATKQSQLFQSPDQANSNSSKPLISKEVEIFRPDNHQGFTYTQIEDEDQPQCDQNEAGQPKDVDLDDMEYCVMTITIEIKDEMIPYYTAGDRQEDSRLMQIGPVIKPGRRTIKASIKTVSWPTIYVVLAVVIPIGWIVSSLSKRQLSGKNSRYIRFN